LDAFAFIFAQESLKNLLRQAYAKFNLLRLKIGLCAGSFPVWQSWPKILYLRGGVSMPTRNVSLTKELDQFVAAKVEAGLYANASEVMRTALRILERDEREYEEKLAVLRAAVDQGFASGIADPGVFSRIRRKHDLPQRDA
jgi:antitoxin ParD1/3/4